LAAGAVAAFGLLLGRSESAPASSKEEVSRQIRFGAEMARQGNWREAIFRWQRALVIAPDNPRILGNLAVAHESLGEYEKADAAYQKALASPGVPDEVRENHKMFLEFYMEHRAREEGPDAVAPPAGESAGPRKDSKP
jgi:Tfp pilus assembly protein PilF